METGSIDRVIQELDHLVSNQPLEKCRQIQEDEDHTMCVDYEQLKRQR